MVLFAQAKSLRVTLNFGLSYPHLIWQQMLDALHQPFASSVAYSRIISQLCKDRASWLEFLVVSVLGVADSVVLVREGEG